MRSPKLQNQNAKRGTALIAVIIMMTFVAAAVVAMGVLFTTETKRTRTTVEAAQLRQMLLAAEPAARAELARGTADRDVPLAIPINGGTLNMHFSDAGNGKALVRATAHIGDAVAVSAMTYGRRENGWAIENAVLSGIQ